MSAYRFVEREKAAHSVVRLCRVLGVSPSGSWAWRKRQPSSRARADDRLTQRIRAIHQASWGTYGVPRIHAELASAGTRCGREAHCPPDARSGSSWLSPSSASCPHDKTRPAGHACPRSRPRVADSTAVPTAEEDFLSLAVILDVFSRRVVGWSMAEHLRAELVVGALEMAIWNRRLARGVIHHSDRGCQYTSLLFGHHCEAVGIRCSMGSVGDCSDNAMAESFFATLECELLPGRTVRTHLEARTALFEYSEVFYNRQRRHSALGYQSPDAFERRLPTTTPIVP